MAGEWPHVPTPPLISLDPVTFPIHRLVWRSRFQGLLRLEGPTAVVWSGVLDAQGRAVASLPLHPLLVPTGGEYFLQALVDPSARTARWTNAARLPLREH